MSSNKLMSRWINGLFASGYGQAVSTIVQISVIPVLISAWGIEGYGEWLAISSIPIWLGLFDFGISNTSANLMAIETDKNKQISIFIAGFSLVITLYLIAVLMVLVIVKLINIVDLFSLNLVSSNNANFTLIILSCHVLIIAIMQNLGGILRTIKKTPQFNYYMHTTRLIEWLIGSIVALSGGDILYFSLSLLLTRTFAFLLIFIFLIVTKHEFFKISSLQISDIKKIINPSLGNLSASLSLVLNLQGLIFLLSTVWPSALVAQFNILRTLSRVGVQACTTISQASWPEFSYAFSNRDFTLLRKLHLRSKLLSILLSCIIFLTLVLYINDLVIFMSGSELDIPFMIVVILLSSSLIHSIWQVDWVLLMSLNSHLFFSYVYSAISILVFVFLAYISREIDFLDVVLVLLSLEIVMAAFARISIKKVLVNDK